MRALLIFFMAVGAFAQSPEHQVADDPNETEPFERGFPEYFYKSAGEKVEGLQKYAIDKPGELMENFDHVPVDDDPVYAFLYFDRLEERFEDKSDKLLWDVTGMLGPIKNKVFVESEGTYNTEKGEGAKSRNEILYGYLVDSFWFAQVGYRRDFVPKKDDREFFVVSAQGMSPFLFEIDVAGYLSDEGVASGILEAEYSFRLSQRSQLVPRFETELSAQEVKDYNIGSGINGFELGLRLTHQFAREFAPYVGLSWEKKVFGTANLLKDAGEDTSEGLFLLGVRMIL